MINKKTLVLNIDFSPLMIIGWQKAIKLEFVNKDIPELGLEAVEYYEDTVTSAGGAVYPIPAVMKTTKFVKKRKKVPLKKRNIFSRDKYTCGYCGKILNDKNITIDHIISRHEWRVRRLPGSPHQWTNVVSCCKPCNFKKGSLSLDKAGMKLTKKVFEPSYNEYLRQSISQSMPQEWRVYFGI